MNKRTSIISLIIITVPSMIIGMVLFQKLKIIIYPNITLQQSHVITIIFNTILATALAYLVWRKHERLVNQLLDEIRNRKQFEEALQESEERYRLIVETAYEGIWILDAEMRITYLNQRLAEIFGYPIEEMMGRPLFEFYDAEIQGQIIQRLKRYRQGLSEQFDVIAHRKDGEELWTLVNASPIVGSGNKFIGLLGMSTDITKRKQTEIALQRQKELLRHLSARLSEVEENERKRLAAELHDMVGQNLTALGINLNIIHASMSAETLKHTYSRVHDSMEILNETIESIRGVITDLRPSVLDDFGLTAAVSWYGALFSKRTGISIKTQAEELLTRLPANTESAMFRIFQESLTNIQKHAQATVISVSLGEENNNIRLLIHDNGIGFDTRHTGKLSDRKGWGLVMMKERAREVSGNFSIKSQVGQGTQVVLEVSR